MAKTANDVLKEWVLRGYITAPPSAPDAGKYKSFIEQAKQSMLAYCKLPLNAEELPDSLFYPWVEISYAIMNGGIFEQSSGTVKSIKEGDETVTYNNEKNKAIAPLIDYSDILNRHRCLF